MTSTELKALLVGERAFFQGLADLKSAVLYGSALVEGELKEDVDLLLVPGRELSGGEKIDLRQAVWERFKGKLPVMLEVVTPTAELSPETLAASGVPTEEIFSR